MADIQYGPFALDVVERITLGGTPSRRWRMSYGRLDLAERVLPATARQTDVVEAFAEERAAFIRAQRPADEPVEVDEPVEARLVRSTHAVGVEGGTLDRFVLAGPIPGISSGLIDDRYPTWVVVGGQSAPMGEQEFERLRAAHEAMTAIPAGPRPVPRPRREWVATLLPEDVLTLDADEWRAPTSWEIRHVVGEGSFTGVSGARAAGLVGVLPQGFRKYTARDGALSRQSISYAMWHLLLHRLGVKRLPEGA